MASVKIYKMDGTEVGTAELSDGVFGVAMNAAVVHDVAVAARNAQRQGNAETKTRREVRGGGRKPYRQKGTGNARHGSTREPQMRGGGSVFGPHRRSYRQRLPQTFRRKALCCMLSDRVRAGALCVLESVDVSEPKTKPFAAMLEKVVPDKKRTLLVTAESSRTVMLSTRNIPKVDVATATDLNVLDVLQAGRVVVLQDALPKLEERLS